MVFRDTGVLENRVKNPSSVTLSTGAASYSALNNSVKKMTVTDIDSAISIYAGAKGSVIDASNAGAGVSIIGGAKSDRFTGSESHTDTFIFNTQSGGKDVINGFVTAGSNKDSILFGGAANVLSNAKISASNKSVKFKFGSKNVLSVKDDSIKGAQLQIDGTTYSSGKNAIIDGQAASLTSAFGGTYKIADGIATVDGTLVNKNLTFKATSAGTNETLFGGTKKTTFKGAGGTDSLVGGSGDDIFFYAKGDTGTATIADFDFKNDKLKIAGGTLRKIETISGSEHGGISFGMSATNNKEAPEVGHFNVTSYASYDSKTKEKESSSAAFTDETVKNTLIHANNKYYWFAQDSITAEVATTGGDGTTVTVVANKGDLITTDKRISSSDVQGYNVIELNYGTNLVKAGVATLVSGDNDKATLPGT